MNFFSKKSFLTITLGLFNVLFSMSSGQKIAKILDLNNEIAKAERNREGLHPKTQDYEGLGNIIFHLTEERKKLIDEITKQSRL
jgi:hypothetical protein